MTLCKRLIPCRDVNGGRVVTGVQFVELRDAGGREIASHGGRRVTGLDAVDRARRGAELGAGEILRTSMDADGAGTGDDLALTRAVADAVGVPVIAAGGVSTLEHARAGLVEGGAQAALAASIFRFGTHFIAEAKAYLAASGLPIRPV